MSLCHVDNHLCTISPCRESDAIRHRGTAPIAVPDGQYERLFPSRQEGMPVRPSVALLVARPSVGRPDPRGCTVRGVTLVTSRVPRSRLVSLSTCELRHVVPHQGHVHSDMPASTCTHRPTHPPRGPTPPKCVSAHAFSGPSSGCACRCCSRAGWLLLGATELARAAVTRPLASGGLPTVLAYGSMLVCVLGVQCSTVSWAGPRLMVEARFLVVTAPVLREVCLVCVGPRGTGPRFRPRFPSALPSAMSAGSGFGLLCPVSRRSQFRRVVSSWVAVAGGVAASGCGVLFRWG